MIFKSESDVPIKKVVAESVPSEARAGMPYDFRRELSDRDKAAISARLDRFVNSDTWDSFVHEGVAAKQLGITPPALSGRSQERLRTAAIEWAGLADGMSDFQQYQLMMLSLLDRSIIDSFDSNIKAAFDREVAAIRTSELRSADDYIYNEVATKIFMSDTYALPADMRKEILEELPKRADIRLPKIIEFPDDLGTARNMLRDLAMIRLIDPSIPLPLTSTHWERIRYLAKAGDGTITLSRAESAFFARIVAAKDIRIDNGGLYITDREPEPSIKSDTARPIPKRI